MSDPKDEIEALKRRIAELEAQQASRTGSTAPLDRLTQLKTDGGAVIGNSVRMGNGHFIGRDYIAQLTQIVHGGEREEDVQNSIALYLHTLRAELSGLPLGEIDTQTDRAQRNALTLRDVYVPLATTLRIDDQYNLPDWLQSHLKQAEFAVMAQRDLRSSERKVRRVSALEALAATPRLTLLGMPGTGKSSFCAHVLLALADAWAGQDDALKHLGAEWIYGGLLPIRIVLREFADRLPEGRKPTAGDLWDHIGDQLHEQGIGFASDDHRFLQRLAQRHGALIVFDGLDECGDVERRNRVFTAVEAFISTYSARCRFILTMRPYAWPEGADYFRGVFELDTFDDAQVVAFIENWYDRLPERGWCTVAQAARKRESLLTARHRAELAELARTPLLLTLMALLHSNRGQLPEDRVELYHETVELLLRRWSLEDEAERALLDGLGVSELKWSSVRRVIQQLAFEVHAQSAGREGDLDIRESALLNALRPLFGDSRDKAAIMVEYIERRTGLLLGLGRLPDSPDPLDNDRRFAFPHRSFREYLAACHLAQHSEDFPGECRRLAVEAPAHWELVLALAARVAQLSQGARAADAVIGCDRVEAFEARHARRPGPPEWRAARVAGLQLRELGVADLITLPDTQAILDRVRHWLAAALPLHPSEGGLPTVERAKLGDLLAELGDPRFDPERLHLPTDPDLGFVRIPADPDFRIGTRRADRKRVAEATGLDAHKNEINDAITPTPEFWIARYPVTVAQFRAFVEDSGFQIAGANALRDADIRPVVFVSWAEASAYAAWLLRQLREAPVFHAHPVAALVRAHGWEVMLPSERAWEKAARGGREGVVFPWGDMFDSDRANIDESGIGDNSVVGAFPPNGYGLYDMAGNVWEWTRTEHDAPYSAHEPEASSGSSAIVVRGGCWLFPRFATRCAFRYRLHPDLHSILGFRVVLVVPLFGDS